MKIAARVLFLFAAGLLLLAACSMPQIADVQTSQTSGTQTSAGTTISVSNDTARGLAVYTAADGNSEVVSAMDPTTNQIVSCIQSAGFAVTGHEGGSGSSPTSVLIVGERSDGGAGAWEVSSTGKITLLEKKDAGQPGSLTPEPGEAPEGLYHHLGWTYHVTAVSDDGKMIVGYAENKRGLSLGPISIPAGTTVGVYWNVDRVEGHESTYGKTERDRYGHLWHREVTRPYVIGTKTKSMPGVTYHHHGSRFEGFLSYLKLFFLNRLDSYLVMTSSVQYDAKNDSYVVNGTDENGNDANATISSNGSIAITEVATPPSNTYSEIIIDTFNPTGPSNVTATDVIALFSETGVANAQNPLTNPTAGALAWDLNSLSGGANPNPTQKGWAYIDYTPTTPLPSGTVLYVRITGYLGVWSGDYGIRVLTAPSSTYANIGSNPGDSPYENDNPANYGDVPVNAPPITVNDTNGLSRFMGSPDIDWVKITLP